LRPILLSLLITVAASAQPLFLQAEHPVAPPRLGVVSKTQTTPRIAWDGTNHLLVWSDDRTSLPANWTPEVVFATRVDAHGDVLDSPNLILPLRGNCLPFWNGKEYVVVSADGYIRISRNGELLDAAPHPPGLPGSLLAIAWTGQRLLVVTNDVYPVQHAALYDASMNVIRADFPPPASTTQVATNGRGFLFSSISTLTATDLDGHVTATNRIATINPDYIASDGENYLVVDQSQRFRAATVTPDLAIRSIGTSYFGSPLNSRYATSVMWDGSHYQVVFVKSTDVQSTGPLYEMKVEVLDSYGTPLNGEGTTLAATSGGMYPNFIVSPYTVAGGIAGSHLMLWSADAWKGITYSEAATAATTTSPPFEFTRGALPEENPVVATAGDVSLLAWREPDASARDRFALFAVRVDRFGRVLDAPIRIADSTCDALAPAVATDGTDFIVAWQLPASILAMRIGRDGRRLDPNPIIVAVSPTSECGPSAPSVVSNGTNYFVAWQRKGVLSGARLSSGGVLLDPVPLSFGAGPVAGLHTASDGHDYFVAWTDATIKQARGVRITAGGTVVDTISLPLILDKTSAVYWSGKNYVTLAASSDGVRAVRITAGGERLDFAPAGSLGPAMPFPFDASTGRVECDAHGCFTYGLKDGVIVATRIDDSGSVVTYTSSPFARGDDAWRSLLVFGGALKSVAYERLASETPYGATWHLFVRSAALTRSRAMTP